MEAPYTNGNGVTAHALSEDLAPGHQKPEYILGRTRHREVRRLGCGQGEDSSLLVPFQPNYRLNHPEHFLVSLSIEILAGTEVSAAT